MVYLILTQIKEISYVLKVFVVVQTNCPLGNTLASIIILVPLFGGSGRSFSVTLRFFFFNHKTPFLRLCTQMFSSVLNIELQRLVTNEIERSC